MKMSMIDSNGVGELEIQGWMVILSYALKGINWAIVTALNPNYELKQHIYNYLLEKGHSKPDAIASKYCERVFTLAKELNILKDA